MNLIWCSTRVFRSKVRKIIKALLCLTLLLLITTVVYNRPASGNCARNATTLRDTDLMDQPPTYSTRSGWVYGNKIGTIPRGTQIQICNKREVGFFGSKQVWLWVKWEAKYGWIKDGSVEEKSDKIASLPLKLITLLFPIASAQAVSIETQYENGKLPDPLHIGSFISIVAGMVAKNLFDLFKKKRKWLGTKRFALKLLPSLVISPIAFLGFLRTAEISLSNDLSLLVVFLFAFQNGFFWEDVLSIGQIAKDEADSEKTASSYST
jgi:hypothetical protein